MARTSLLVALALSPVAHALGVIEPTLCPCAAKEEVVEPISGLPETITLPNGQCNDFKTIPCTGTFVCDVDGWTYAAAGGSCASESTLSGCEDLPPLGLGGDFVPPLAGECCGSCLGLPPP